MNPHAPLAARTCSRRPLARLRVAPLLVLTLCTFGRGDVAGAPARLRQGPGGVLPIGVAAAPAKTLAYGHVRLSGSTGATGANSLVTLRIQPPGAAPAIVLTAKVASDGRFSADFSKTAQLGTYAVQATAPDKKGQASTSFRVVAADVIPGAFGHTADSLVVTTQQALDAVRQGVQGVPPSPERAEVEKRLAELDQRMDGVPAQVANLTQQMQKVFKARAQVALDNPQWDAYVERVDGWQTEASARAVDLRGHIKSASAETQRCGKLDRYSELLTLAGETMSVMAAPFDFTESFWSDKIPNAFIARAEPDASPAAKFVMLETMKTGVAALHGGGGLGMLRMIPTLVMDASALLMQLEFSKYCQKLEGPIAATFLGESFTKQGQPFISYTIQLDGKLVLMYDKNASTAKPIGVIGYIEGSGRFKVSDNQQLITRLTPGTVLFHKIYAGTGTPYVNDVSQPVHVGLPNAFRVPVKGTLAGDSILLLLEPATYDFADIIEGHSIYVVLPAGGMVPQIIHSKFALQKAFPILDRVIRRHPVLQVSYAGGTRAQGTFARDTTNPEKTARVRTQLTIQACNPGCLYTAPAQPKTKK